MGSQEIGYALPRYVSQYEIVWKPGGVVVLIAVVVVLRLARRRRRADEA